MKRFAHILLVALVLALLFGWASCKPADDDSDGQGQQGDPQDKPYNPDLEGFAGGSSIFIYSDGFWETYPISVNLFPLYSLWFTANDKGYAAGRMGVASFSQGIWSDMTPPDAQSGMEWVRVISGTGAVFVLGKTEAWGTSGLFTYYPETDSWDSFDYAKWSGKEEAQIHDIAYSEETGVLLLVEADDRPFLVSFSENSPVVESIYPQDQTVDAALFTLSVVGASVWAAGTEYTQDQKGGDVQIPVILSRVNGTWQRTAIQGNGSFQEVQKIVMTSATSGYASVWGDHSYMWQFNGSDWTESNMPQAKNENFIIYDMAFVDDFVGWAVGHSSEYNEPLMLLHSEQGWETARAPYGHRESGDEFYTVTMFKAAQSDDDDDSADDDDDDDSTDDDDSVDDDDDVI